MGQLPDDLIPEDEALDWVQDNHDCGKAGYVDFVRQGQLRAFGRRSLGASLELIPFKDRAGCELRRVIGVVIEPWLDRMVSRADLVALVPDKWKPLAEEFTQCIRDIARAEIAGSKNPRTSTHRLVYEKAIEILNDPKLRPPPGRGRKIKVTRCVMDELRLTLREDTIQGYVSPAVTDWEKKHPGK